MGLAVYITHDISDFFLATSKTLNYISSPITVPYFTFFVLVWTYLRHYVNIVILYSILTTFRTVGPFELDWETQQYKCSLSQYITFGLLAFLQGINMFWMYFIIKVAWNIAFRHVEKDVRSDDEEDEAEEDVATGQEPGAQLGGGLGHRLEGEKQQVNGFDIAPDANAPVSHDIRTNGGKKER
ncbi:MAG: hypothetical protein Q9163_003337 [Psora crenata]